MLLPGSEIVIPNEMVIAKRARTFTLLDSHVRGFFTMPVKNGARPYVLCISRAISKGAALKFGDFGL